MGRGRARPEEARRGEATEDAHGRGGGATARPQTARLTADVASFRPHARALLRSSDLTVTFVTDQISIPSTRVGGAGR